MNYLESLEVKYAGEKLSFSPEFNQDTLNYTMTVDSTVLNVNLTGTISEDAKVTGLGKTTLKTGENVIPIAVTAENGEVRNYKLTVTKEPSSNALITIRPSGSVQVP